MSKKRLIQFIILFLFMSASFVFADFADFTILWTRTYDSGNEDIIRDINAKSNIHAVGHTYIKNKDYLIMKYNNQGDLLWRKTWDSGLTGGFADNSGDQGRGIAVDDNEDVYVTGNSPASTHSRAVTLKYAGGSDPPASWVYDVPNGDCEGDAGTNVAIDANYVYVVGVSCKDYISEGYGDWDFLIIKYDKSGNIIWSRTYDGGFIPPSNGGDAAMSVDVDSTGNIFVTGETYNGSNYDFWTMKLNSGGNQLWNRKINYVDDHGFGTALDSQNNVYVVGYLYYGAPYYADYAFIRKYDTNGNTVWSYLFGDYPISGFYDIDIDNNNNLYLGGYIYNFNNNNYDFLTVKMDSNGNIIWFKGYDDGGQDGGLGISIDSQKNVYLGGFRFSATYDTYIIKYAKPCGGPFSGINFTDNTLTAGQTLVKKTHFDELRWDVNILRDNAEVNTGTGWYSFADTIYGYLGNFTPIRALHLTELRQKLGDVYTQCPGSPDPSYTDPTVTAGQTPVKRTHVQELRDAILNAR